MLTKKIRPGKMPNVRIEDTELADLFRKARGYGLTGSWTLITYRQAAELTGISHETWRSVETRRTYEPGPEILRAVTKTPWAPPYEELVAALERDRKRLFEAAYRGEGKNSRSAVRHGRTLGRTTPSTS